MKQTSSAGASSIATWRNYAVVTNNAKCLATSVGFLSAAGPSLTEGEATDTALKMRPMKIGMKTLPVRNIGRERVSDCWQFPSVDELCIGSGQVTLSGPAFGAYP